MAKVIDLAISLAFNQIKYRARVIRDLETVPTVLASEGRLSQVLLNLLLNAAHAIEDGAIDRNSIRVQLTTEDDQVIVEVQDTGHGILDEDLPRLFDPFFTTKPHGKGTGLGLPVSRSIIEGFGGSLTVTSKPGQGSTFRLALPVATETGDEPTPDEPREETTQMSGRVLVVDDEEAVRNMLGRVLACHETRLAQDGNSARQILEVDQDFDLIICDLMMPGMSGMELHAWLTGVNRPLAEKMVFVTGGTFTAQARAFLDQVPNARLDKPFNLKDLRRLAAASILASRQQRRAS
jgi:two-component system cell cycle sensor histidine kinase/response regulator CckA